MDITPVMSELAQRIQRYGDGEFVISAEVYQGSVLVRESQTEAWSVSAIDELSLEALEPVLALKDEFDILLLGAGSQIHQVDSEIRDALRFANISLDVMDTGAACRTYNILMNEGRRVIAALIAV